MAKRAKEKIGKGEKERWLRGQKRKGEKERDG
jgi:hypothetical protein